MAVPRPPCRHLGDDRGSLTVQLLTHCVHTLPLPPQLHVWLILALYLPLNVDPTPCPLRMGCPSVSIVRSVLFPVSVYLCRLTEHAARCKAMPVGRSVGAERSGTSDQAGGIHMIASCVGSRCETSLGTKFLFIGRKSEGSKRESAQSELR